MFGQPDNDINMNQHGCEVDSNQDQVAPLLHNINLN